MLESLQEIFHIYNTYDLVRAIADFAIVSALIYQILLLIKGTRAVQMLIGLLLIIVFYFISKDEYLGLSTLNWLLDKFIASFILVVIVLFQDDIRRGLTKFGKSRLFSGLTSSEGAQVVEELVRACTMLAERRIGALIAIEADAELTPFADEGIRVDSMVSRELLFAIFNPANANPLHDGAVVVRGDRVLAAGCFLPLTSNPRVDKTLGTRHRAAIGLSEDTDAPVLVVSEETGIISVAQNGALRRKLDANALRELLQRVLGPGSAAPATKPATRPAGGD